MVNSTQDKRKATGKHHEHIYEPRGGCLEVFESREEEVLISGPAGTGKSRACLEKIHAICLLTPNTRALILRKTLRSLGSTALVTWRNFVIKEALLTGTVVYYGGSSQEAAQYRYRNGSTVTIGGLDNPTRVMSSEYDIVYIQEATEITIDDLEYTKTRLRNWNISFQQLLMDCNPNSDKHPLKLRCNEGACRLIESRHEDNPRLFDVLPDGRYQVTDRGAKYMEILDGLTGVRYKRLRLGLWVSAEGVIYEEFDPVTHVLDWEHDEEGNRLPLPAEWPRYWAIDFGYVEPFVLKCYAKGDDGELYVYREIYMTGRTVAEHAEQILSIVTKKEEHKWWDHLNRCERVEYRNVWIEPRPTAIICDHDAEDRRTFERATGLRTLPAKKAISIGIDLHKERLKINSDTGYARFYLMRDALVERDEKLAQTLRPVCTQDEYACYAWKVGANGRVRDEPVDQDNHGMDADRYMTMYLDFKGQARVSLISMDGD